MNKLQRARQLELPPELFGDVSEKLVSAWRARAAKEYPSDLLAAGDSVRYTLLATLCHVRQTEIADSLVDLFIQLVQKINTRAEKKVEGEFIKGLQKVRGKEGMMLRVAEAALAAEAAASEARYKARIRTVLRSSHSNHWRRMLSPLLSVLELKCNSTAYRPVRYFDKAERIPLDGVVPEQWQAAVLDDKGRVERIRTSCACWSACGTRCGARRSGWPAQAGDATRRTTCRRTSRATGTCITGRSASRWTRASSSTSCRRSSGRL
ncbi:hypothetical protein ACFRCI_14065 [Streptomyces sp. NPDC056638]|uniref:hypothetical protein n=1 Tax=Streptomyces sp. NPDC056638 TaxID=3345887 RepID=UPI0036A3A6E9